MACVGVRARARAGSRCAQSALVTLLWLGSAGSLDVDASEIDGATDVADGSMPRVAIMSDCPPPATSNNPNYAHTGDAIARADLAAYRFRESDVCVRAADRSCVVDSSPGFCALLKRFDTALLREVRRSRARTHASQRPRLARCFA